MTRRALLVPAVALALGVVAGCGSSSDDDGGTTASESSADSMPTAVPAAEGAVTTGYAVTVIQKDDRAVHACLGFTTAIFPPDCGGPLVAGWDWSVWQLGDDYRTVGRTTFGEFAVTGTWDGSTLEVTDAVPGKNSPDWAGPADPSGPPPGATRDELEQAARAVEDLPGVGVADVRGGRVHVDVTYDDGSIQDWCDQEYGDGVVVVTSELYDVG